MKEDPFHLKYKYIKKLGSGGCGEVFLAENIKLGSIWAIKEIAKDRGTTISGYIEPRILKCLNHPALPRICDVYEDESRIYIVEDYIEGNSMKQELAANGKFDEDTVIDWGIQLCSVLDYLHGRKPNPVIYGDMKPENIIVTKEGFIKLIDFGVSSILAEETIVPEGTEQKSNTHFIGTRGYAAPEQFAGRGISQQSDIYSLGITLLQLLTGIDPNKAINIIQQGSYCEYISQGMFKILQKCINPDPAMRFKGAGYLMNELRNYSRQNNSSAEDLKNSILASSNSANLSKITAITGSPGTGVSTITAAMAEYAARGPDMSCIIDLSISGTLDKSLLGKGIESTGDLLKVTSNLYYIKLGNHDEGKDIGELIINKWLGELQRGFSNIFIDAEPSLLRYVSKYSNQIFIVSDMNPYNTVRNLKLLQLDEITSDLIPRIHFIFNKFYKEGLKPQNILHAALLKKDGSCGLEELVAYAKVSDVPYDERIYIKWVYSFFGEPVRFSSLSGSCFGKAISGMVSSITGSKKRKASLSFGCSKGNV
jgi:serine/threonine-protein kinase